MLSFVEKRCSTITKNLSLKRCHTNKKKYVFNVNKESVFASFKGSVSLEASLVIPLLIFSLMAILIGIEMVRLQTNVFEALHQGESIAFSEANASRINSTIFEYMDQKEFPFICVRGGNSGIAIKNLSSIDQDGMIRIIASYEMKPFIYWLPLGAAKVSETVTGHSFTGYVSVANEIWGHEEDEFVYITKTGTKYHRDSSCSFLNIHPVLINATDVISKRNRFGAIYHPCETCHPTLVGNVFVTPDGNRFHGNSSCPSLKRTGRVISLEKAEGDGYSACSKCG